MADTPTPPTDLTITFRCGWTLSGPADIVRTRDDEHDCLDLEDPPSWHSSVFSLWGAMTFVAIGYAVASILEAAS